jgi:exonuclease VII small subunit
MTNDEYPYKITTEEEYEQALSELERDIEKLRNEILTKHVGKLERNIEKLKSDDKLQKTVEYLWSDAYKRDVLDKKYN